MLEEHESGRAARGRDLEVRPRAAPDRRPGPVGRALRPRLGGCAVRRHRPVPEPRADLDLRDLLARASCALGRLRQRLARAVAVACARGRLRLGLGARRARGATARRIPRAARTVAGRRSRSSRSPRSSLRTRTPRARARSRSRSRSTPTSPSSEWPRSDVTPGSARARDSRCSSASSPASRRCTSRTVRSGALAAHGARRRRAGARNGRVRRGDARLGALRRLQPDDDVAGPDGRHRGAVPRRPAGSR